ncbi:AMP-binding protein [Shigella flexneri]
MGWVTGHSYLGHGPLANGATTIMFEGVPNYPATNQHEPGGGQAPGQHPLHCPTAIRALMAKGKGANRTSRSSLRIMGSVGEPINPEAWEWYYRTIGPRPVRRLETLVADRDSRHPHQPAARLLPIK